MPSCTYNHISVNAKDVLEETRQFYEDLFDAEVLPIPNMGVGKLGYWLKVGGLQLHLIGVIKPSGEPLVDTIPTYQHTALGMDDFEAFYRSAREQDVPEDTSIWGYPLNVLPNGQVQYYVRDPAGNLIEVNWHDASTLPEDIRERAQAVRFEQTPEQMKAELFLKQA